MADTGCQSCLASIKVIRRLGLCEDDLIPVTMHMHAANNNGIKILGAIILRFTGRSPSGQTLETRQIVYVTSDADKLFLSREACTALRMISENFPTVGETLSKAMALDEDLMNHSEPPQVQYHPHLKVPSTHLATAPAARHHHKNPPNYHSQLQRLTGSAYRHGS